MLPNEAGAELKSITLFLDEGEPLFIKKIQIYIYMVQHSVGAVNRRRLASESSSLSRPSKVKAGGEIGLYFSRKAGNITR